jgi:hypothetical protein
MSRSSRVYPSKRSYGAETHEILMFSTWRTIVLFDILSGRQKTGMFGSPINAQDPKY